MNLNNISVLGVVFPFFGNSVIVGHVSLGTGE